MSFSEKDMEIFLENELKPEDTFRFECKMCGNCCRRRKELILLTGADIFRIARALGKTTTDVIKENTMWYIGNTSHIPVVVLKEQMDGSCSFLKMGRCVVHQDKPAVCALYPLGRIYNLQDYQFHYFLNPKICQPGREDGKLWTIQEWFDEFKIEETAKMTQAWNNLMGGLAIVTHQMREDEIEGRLLDVLLFALYLGYDTSKPYIEQIEQHMILLTDVFAREFHKTLKFEHQ